MGNLGQLSQLGSASRHTHAINTVPEQKTKCLYQPPKWPQASKPSSPSLSSSSTNTCPSSSLQPTCSLPCPTGSVDDAPIRMISLRVRECGCGFREILYGVFGADGDCPPSSPRPLRNHPLVRSRDVHHRRCIDLRHHHRLRDVL